MTPNEVIQGINEIMTDDGGTDYVALYENLGIVGDVVAWILGMLVIFVLIGFSIVVSLEVLFMNLPAFQSSIYKLMEKSDTANKILGLCLRDAKRAIMIANTKETGKSANQVYLGIKIKVIFITFVIIGIILGPGVLLVNSLAGIVQDILSAF